MFHRVCLLCITTMPPPPHCLPAFLPTGDSILLHLPYRHCLPLLISPHHHHLCLLWEDFLVPTPLPVSVLFHHHTTTARTPPPTCRADWNFLSFYCSMFLHYSGLLPCTYHPLSCLVVELLHLGQDTLPAGLQAYIHYTPYRLNSLPTTCAIHHHFTVYHHLPTTTTYHHTYLLFFWDVATLPHIDPA